MNKRQGIKNFAISLKNMITFRRVVSIFCNQEYTYKIVRYQQKLYA